MHGMASGNYDRTDSTAAWDIFTSAWYYEWEVAEEEPAKPKYKAPRPERKTNQLVQKCISLPMKQYDKQMLSSQRWSGGSPR